MTVDLELPNFSIADRRMLERLFAWHLPDKPEERATILSELPTFARTRNATRWHIPRSGRESANRRVVSFWCGPGHNTALVNGIPLTLLQTDDPQDGAPICGTCVGRAVGAGRVLEGILVAGEELLFEPRTSTPPKWCPANKSSYWWDIRYGDRMTCPLCGAENLRVNAVGGPYNGGLQLKQHRTGPALVPPCPYHGWARLGLSGLCYCSTTKGTHE